MKFSPGIHTEQFTGTIKSMVIRGFISQNNKPYKKLQVIFEDDDLGGLFSFINVKEDGTVNEASDGGRLLKSLQTQGFTLDLEIINPSEDPKPEKGTESQYEAVITATMGGRKDVPVTLTPYPKNDGNIKWEVTGTGTPTNAPAQPTLAVSNMTRLSAESVLEGLPSVFEMSDFVMATNSKLGEDAPTVNDVKVHLMTEFIERGVLVREGNKFRKTGAK